MPATPCILLAGGLGTRLRAAVPDLPKCLAPVAGRPFLHWQLRQLSRAGVADVVLALGHGAQLVLDALDGLADSGVQLHPIVESSRLGTGGAVRHAMRSMSVAEALLANGDTLLTGDLSPLMAPLQLAQGEQMRMATAIVSDRDRFGGVQADSQRWVTAFLEKGTQGKGAINAGFYRLHRDALAGVTQDAFSLEQHVLPGLVARRALRACPIGGQFLDIGVPQDYRRLQNERELLGD